MASLSSLFDPELLRRYDVPGPRYTSYPTAPQFTPGFGEADLRAVAAASNGDPIPRPISLYLHVPFCTSPCFYCGCNRIITRDKARGTAYLTRLYREIGMASELFDRDRDVEQVHFGGGTPNFLDPLQIAEVMDVLRRHFHFAPGARMDCSIELDPRFITPAEVGELAAAGFNRASLGVQDFDPAVQEAVNRVQGVAQTLGIIDACRAHGFRSVNVDLIYGLPKQTLEGFSRTLDITLQARPDRLAIYGYAHLPSIFRPQQRIRAEDLPSPEQKLDLLRLAIEKLGQAGYEYIGMDHFALPTDELARAQREGGLHRNFMGYTTHAESDLVGLGVSAISHIGASFSQNPRDIAGWEQAIDEGRLPVWRGMRMDEDDVVRADVIQQLMCHGRLDFDAIGRRHVIDFREYFADALARLRPLQADGLVEVDGSGLRATMRGRLLLRIIAMCFDRYLTAAGGSAPLYSRTV
ncbi:oxygen-independent coproporphyrinogen III oxidase [Pseudoxanthomonas sp. SGNA-20]|jgi:oxygen-independent coproporphyrinogen III oxidase|uniref:Coproporphyrinogen-III oxidase n=1 Tax=Pseudoxanthomonas taiwanensis J19 TaxID=935569 RepID=A0A562DZA5_9GAMM|nr:MULTISPECIES: oxygen-independent coproporphyrinogen III oxidase [Pseudoxanthomonas]RRN59051.1 oxygen-independent coproporphyrinogen III oxidase [Pseudoxanthomonas sp. SGNA-20]RRN81057.1 oxygen-independent coproporphyrinogen III oxidase [Pseudoxanthomonas sp. SGD-10]TWH14956.1 oxygen-independent coproporphyrinogen-3 oxidase [Pseudoxanthomonas taiwanensis J19]